MAGSPAEPKPLLERYRVLDLCDERGLLCGQLLADLGADLIVVEPPGGSPVRRLAPFHDDRPDPNGSLYWWACNRNKRAITLDFTAAQGKALLLQLIARVDFLIESAPPGQMDSLGLGYADLAQNNPGLIYVSISPFGPTGPKAAWASSDLVVMAAGGPLALTGDDDRPPLRVSVPQAYLHAAADGALGAMLAHFHRVRCGRGQQVDVSAQESVTIATQSGALATHFNAAPFRRHRGGLRLGILENQIIWPARDGHVTLAVAFGANAGPFMVKVRQFLYEQSQLPDADPELKSLGPLLADGRWPEEARDKIIAVIRRFTQLHTKAELMELAQRHGLLIGSLETVPEVFASPQLKQRGYWRMLEHPELGRAFAYPGPFARFGATPLQYRRRPPTIGEHNGEVYVDEMGLSQARMRELRELGSHLMADEKPLSGVRICDFTWAMAAPMATRLLADFGATVVRIEPHNRYDAARTQPPFRNNQQGAENSAMWSNCDAGKLSIVLDLARPMARRVAMDLVGWAGVAMESFSPGTMRKWGLHYESLRQVRPDLIMLSSSLMGQDGPMADYAGWGYMGAAMAGFHQLTGWPDRDPSGPFHSYTDYVVPRMTALALLAALDHRRLTGEGQYIDFSQVEAAIHFLAPAYLDYSVNRRAMAPMGNRDLNFAPHGVYPCAGDDRWIAVVCENDEQWQALCAVMQLPELKRDPRFASASARLTHGEELDRIVSRWTSTLDQYQAEAGLQAAGVPASAVQNSAELSQDPQLAHRGHFVQVKHPLHGTIFVESPAIRLSLTPGSIQRAAPTLGADTQHVLGDLLGYSEERITQLAADGALG